MKHIAFAGTASVLLTLFLLASPASAQDIMQTMASVGNLFYGIAAGLAVLMLAYGALRWKTTEDPGTREAAKRGVLAVLLGIALIIVASSAVNMTYKKTADTNVSVTVARITTTTVLTTTSRRPTTTTTTIATSSTSSTSTTTTSTIPYLIPENLVKCVKRQGDLYSAGYGCPNCVQQMNVFFKDTVGSGQTWYEWMRPGPGPAPDRRCRCTVYPCWCYKSGNAMDNCHTFSELNSFWGCGLICKPGYVYYNCAGSGSALC